MDVFTERIELKDADINYIVTYILYVISYTVTIVK